MVEWFYVLGDRQMGPVNLDELQSLYTSEQIPPDTLVWNAAMGEEWKPISQIPVFATLSTTSPAVSDQADDSKPPLTVTAPEPGAPDPAREKILAEAHAKTNAQIAAKEREGKGYKCPHCGRPVQRATSNVARFLGGVVGMLFVAAFGGFDCLNCGKIPKRDFPPEVRIKMMLGTLILITVAVAIVFIVLLVVMLVE